MLTDNQDPRGILALLCFVTGFVLPDQFCLPFVACGLATLIVTAVDF